MKHVVIVGGGITGLAVAWHLHRAAQDGAPALRVTVLESESRSGGRIATERSDGFQIEHGANGFLDSKPSTLTLAQELGLAGELLAARPEAKNRYILWRDRLQPLPTGLGTLIRSGLLSWRGKLRLLAEPFVRARIGTGDESVQEFARRRVGREAADVLVDALVTGIHAGDATLLSAAAAFPQMVQLERTYGSLFRAQRQLRRERIVQREPAARGTADSASGPGATARGAGSTAHTLWSLRLGMGQLIDRLSERCGGDVVLGARVRRIARDPAGCWTVASDSGGSWSADVLVLAAPSFVQSALLESVDAELAHEVDAIRYNSIVVVALGFRAADIARPLDGFGYLAPQRSRGDVLGVLWSSSIFEHRSPSGVALVQAMCGGWQRPEIVQWSDEAIVSAVLGELRHTIGTTAPPVHTRIIRWPQAIPQYHVGHAERVATIERHCRRLRGLFLSGNSFRGVSVNDCVEEAARCAAEILGYLGAK